MPAVETHGALAERCERLPLFPLRSVLFPQGVLWLTVVEPRYQALLKRCQQKRRPFGAVCIRVGEELEDIGVLAGVDQIEPGPSGSERVRCRGHQRFRVLRERAPGEDGLRRAKVTLLADDDAAMAPLPTMFPAVQALGRALAALRAEGRIAADEPPRYDSAAWVANRWCELLPIPLQAKQQLMALADPMARLALVDRYLRDQRVIS